MPVNTIVSNLSDIARALAMRSKVVVGAAALALGMAGTAHALGPGGTYIQGGYADWDDFDNGFNVGGSFGLIPGVRAFADYTDTDLEQLRIGGGLGLPVPGPLSLELGGSYQNLQTDGPGGLDDDGFGAHGIARLALIPTTFTLSGKLEYVFRDDLQDELVVGVDADYRFLPQLSAFVSYEVYDELDNNLLVIGGRLNF